MEEFSFYPRTKIIFGEGVSSDIGQYLSSWKRVLLLYGEKHFVSSGLRKIVLNSLDLHGISYIEYGGITPNPDISHVENILSFIKNNPVDCLLAIGGGSVIDVAKCVAANLGKIGDPLRFNKKEEVLSSAYPVIAIPTIASAGSECSDSCVISSYKEDFKGGFNSDFIRPVLAIEDPVLTYHVSLFQTGCGIIDSMAHSLERFFEDGDSEIGDDFALTVIKRLYDAGNKLIGDLQDKKARAEALLLSSLSHNGLTGIGKVQSFVVHPLEHAVSACYPTIAHGEGIAIIFSSWAKYTFAKNLNKLALLGRTLLNLSHEEKEEQAIMFLSAWEKLAKSFSLRTSLKECGIKKEDIHRFALMVTKDGTRTVGRLTQSLSIKDCEAIYRLAYRNKGEKQ